MTEKQLNLKYLKERYKHPTWEAMLEISSEQYIRGLKQGKFDCEMDQLELKQKYDEALSMLAEYSPPCEIDGFMDKNTDYCSINCGVDEEIFKTCWDMYIVQKIGDSNE